MHKLTKQKQAMTVWIINFSQIIVSITLSNQVFSKVVLGGVGIKLKGWNKDLDIFL